MILVAILTVRTGAAEQFRAYEKHAATVMKTHGGRIERTVVVAPEVGTEVFREVHIVTFPSAQAYAAYRGDAGLAQAAHLRETAVVDTQVLIGEEGPSYS